MWQLPVKIDIDKAIFVTMVWTKSPFYLSLGIAYSLCKCYMKTHFPGATHGIGTVTALELSRRGANVILLCRNTDLAKKVASDIQGNTGHKVFVVKCDLASLDSVRECAAEILSKYAYFCQTTSLSNILRFLEANYLGITTNRA